MEAVMLLGGPMPYREAVSARLRAADVEVTDITTTDDVEGEADVVLVYCESEEQWERLTAFDGLPAVAVLHRLDLEDYERALASNAGAVQLDTSSEIIVAVARAASRGETLVPSAVATALALKCRQQTLPRTLTDAEKALADALLAGHTIERMARELSYSDRTIRRRLQGLYLKLGAGGRSTAIEALRRMPPVAVTP